MVIRRGNLSWVTSFSSTDIHVSEESSRTTSNTSGESNDSWCERQCPVILKSNPQNQVKWVRE